MKRPKTIIPEEEKILPLYVVEHFYLLEEALGITLKKEKEELRDAILKKLNKMCNNNSIGFAKQNFDINTTFFFKNKPKNATEVIGLFVSAIVFEQKTGHVVYFCSQNIGKKVLNEYVFPLIAKDDFAANISLMSVRSAVGFYFKQDFNFKNSTESENFDKLINTYGFDNVINWLRNKSTFVMPKDVKEFYDEDFYEMTWKRHYSLNAPFEIDFLESVKLFKDKQAIYADKSLNNHVQKLFLKVSKYNNLFDEIMNRIYNISDEDFNKDKSSYRRLFNTFYDDAIAIYKRYVHLDRETVDLLSVNMISTYKERVVFLPQKTEEELLQILEEQEDQNEMQMSDNEIDASISVCAHCNNTINNYDPFVIVTKNSKYCGTICQKKQEIKKVF